MLRNGFGAAEAFSRSFNKYQHGPRRASPPRYARTPAGFSDQVGSRMLANMGEPRAEQSGFSAQDDGWISTSLPEGGMAHLRLQERDGQRVITDVYVHAPDVTAATLRSINTTKIHAYASGLDQVLAVKAALGTILDKEFAPNDEPSLAELRSRSVQPREQWQHQPDRPPRAERRPRLGRPTGDDPDGFYGLVAEAYREYATTTGRAAAAAIAAEAGVPVTTVHRWVREARRRGHLPPGKQGRTG
jgi:hypothetical protein